MEQTVYSFKTENQFPLSIDKHHARRAVPDQKWQYLIKTFWPASRDNKQFTNYLNKLNQMVFSIRFLTALISSCNRTSIDKNLRYCSNRREHDLFRSMYWVFLLLPYM